MKKIILLIFTIVLLSSFVSASCSDYDSSQYITCLDWESWETGWQNWTTERGVMTPYNFTTFPFNDLITGKITASGTSNSEYFDFADQSTTTTIQFRINVTNNLDGFWIGSGDASPTYRYEESHFVKCDTGASEWQYYDGSYKTISTCNLGQIYNFTIVVYDNGATSTADYYVDGSLKVSGADDRGSMDRIGALGHFIQTSGNSVYVDELVVCSGNRSTGCPLVTPSVNFEIYAHSFWDNSTINNFNATFNGSTYSTTNGTIITPYLQNQSSEFNITIQSNNWFNKTIEHNISNNLNISLFQTDINFSFRFDNGDFVVTPINLTSINTGVFFNVTGGSININPNADIQNFSVSCDNNVFAPFDISINFSALENATYNFSVNETPTILTFIDANTTNPIENATIQVFYPSGVNINLTTNSSGQVNFSYIYNNTLEFGNYTFRFSKVGFLPLNISETINSSNVPFSKSYNISRATLIINVYNRDGYALLNGFNVSVAFVELFNETITTGTLTKNNLSLISGEYIIYVGSEGFKTESITFDFTNQENLTLNFYLLNLSDVNYGNFFVTTQDSFFREVTGASCNLLEYVPSELSFVSVSNCVTNINAECSYAIELNVKTYYVRCTSVIGGEVFIAETNTNGEILTSNNEVRNLIFFTRTTFDISTTTNLVYDITESFVNNVSSISIEFFTSDGTSKEVCIEYFKKVSGGWVSVTNDTYCLTSSSAIQNIDASVTLNRSNDYKAEVYVKESFNNILKTFNYPSIVSMSGVFATLIISLKLVLVTLILGGVMLSRAVKFIVTF